MVDHHQRCYNQSRLIKIELIHLIRSSKQVKTKNQNKKRVPYQTQTDETEVQDERERDDSWNMLEVTERVSVRCSEMLGPVEF